ncbi:MAG TPA: hypothetical protein VKB13_07350, partial [Gaiellaceae bacterium]|nr:hypothetical protein [Gaiellaceae bacterium]
VRRSLALALTLAATLAFAGSAGASQLIDRNARNIRLKVSPDGKAMVSYRAHGRHWDVLAWGAVNAFHPSKARKQVQFNLDRAGGWGTFGKKLSFRNACRAYDGPELVHVVTACKAPDGSYWALQQWQRALPNLGLTPWLPEQRAWALHLSHWKGPLAQLEAWTDWSWDGRYHSIFGRLTYLGEAVHGFKTNKYGARLDKYGRLVYLDTFGSKHGPGWRRENSFVTHKPTGVFCYNFRPRNPLLGGYAHPPEYSGGVRGPGNGLAYRLTVEGPGVTPDVKWEGKGLLAFDESNPQMVSFEDQMNAILDGLNDKLCSHH